MKLLRIAVLGLLPLAIAACGNSGSDTGSAKAQASSPVGDDLPQAQKINMGALKTAAGFAVGNPTAKRELYVMFDPQCPHCGALWQNMKSLWPRAKIIWVPVSIKNRTGALQAAGLLMAPIPSKAMDEHEDLLAANHNGMEVNAADVPTPLKNAIERNTQLHQSFGFEHVPVIIGTNEKTGKLAVLEGPLTGPEIVAKFNWAEDKVAPAAQPVPQAQPAAPQEQAQDPQQQQ